MTSSLVISLNQELSPPRRLKAPLKHLIHRKQWREGVNITSKYSSYMAATLKLEFMEAIQWSMTLHFATKRTGSATTQQDA